MFHKFHRSAYDFFLQDAEAVVQSAQLPDLLSELNVTMASPDVVLEVLRPLKTIADQLYLNDLMHLIDIRFDIIGRYS